MRESVMVFVSLENLKKFPPDLLFHCTLTEGSLEGQSTVVADFRERGASPEELTSALEEYPNASVDLLKIGVTE